MASNDDGIYGHLRVVDGGKDDNADTTTSHAANKTRIQEWKSSRKSTKPWKTYTAYATLTMRFTKTFEARDGDEAAAKIGAEEEELAMADCCEAMLPDWALDWDQRVCNPNGLFEITHVEEVEQGENEK